MTDQRFEPDQPAGPADEPTETGDTDSAPTTGSEGRRMVPAGALVVAIMVAAALGILAVVALASGGQTQDRDTDAARLAAGRFGERFLTFDHDQLDEWKADVLSLSTGGFAKEVDDVEAGLRRLVSEAGLDANTQVTEIFMGQVDKGSVSAVLLYDRDLSGTSGRRSENDRYMQLSLLLVDGEWLVDDVIDIASAQDLASPGSTTTAPSTTTTSPPG